MLHITPEQALDRITTSNITEDFYVDGDLDLSKREDLLALSPHFRGAWGLDLSGCAQLESLPDNLDVKRLDIAGCSSLETLPAGLKTYQLIAQNTGLRSIPDDIQVEYKLDLTNCRELASLPDGLTVGSLIIRDCVSLKSLPNHLSVYFLDAAGCHQLQTWGEDGHIEVGNINLRDCFMLSYLPDWITKISSLNIRNCTNITSLPDTLEITSMIEIAESSIRELPPKCKSVTVRWADVEIDERIAFHPEQITAQEILETTNIELRRVKLERLGYEKFFNDAQAEELDKDVDPGGIRRLLRVDFQDRSRWQQDEPLVCLSVICPSTARQYVIRVPPMMRTCHGAAAWIAGFDDPAVYQPVVET